MGGGLMQLVLKGQMDEYITANPCIDYYKYVYKKHTNFSMVTEEITPENNANLGYRAGVKMTFKIKRHADLLSKIYLSFTIPDIYSNNDMRFRWVENLGFNYIARVELLIDGKTIETLYRDWMNIWNELTNKDGIEYNKLIGNVSEYTAPYSFQPKFTVINNKLYNVNYPVSTINDTVPSIRSREIQVPLNFWFTRNPSLAIPLLKLANNEITVDLYTNEKGFEGLYKVWSEKLGMYISSSFYNKLYNSNISIDNFTKTPGYDVRNKLFLTYVFLDTVERARLLIENNSIDYVIDTVKFTEDNIDTSAETSLYTNITNANNHIKEIIWFIRRNDVIDNFNDYTNYTASAQYMENMGILKSATIYWSKDTERANFPANYYNQIQPYYHHTNIPRTGIYCYSFALFPEKNNTSGSYNNSKITTSLSITTNPYINDPIFNNIQNITKSILGSNYNYNVKYNVSYFVRDINVLSIINGSAQLKFV